MWWGSCNLRDLGGLRLRDGSRTASGRLYRSGRIESLDERGWRSAGRAGLRTIVDLRNADERGLKPTDPAVDDAVSASFERFHRPIEAQSNTEFMAHYGDQLAHPSYYPANLDYFPALVRSAIEAIVDANGPTLFHCSAGKDRTGLMSAILLTLNGVVLDDVLADYERGVRGYAAWQHAHPGQGRERVLSAGELDTAVDDRVDTLAQWLTSIDMAERLVSQVGVDQRLLDRASILLHHG